MSEGVSFGPQPDPSAGMRGEVSIGSELSELREEAP
jgi:hypothetical protein